MTSLREFIVEVHLKGWMVKQGTKQWL